MPMVDPCNLCGSKKYIIDKKDNFPDGFCWTCATLTCPALKPVKRPAFFERFKSYTLQELLLLTYHWACQSSYEEILQDVSMDCEKIWYYFKALQELCRQATDRKGKLGLTGMVEVSVVKMGDVFILGALDRKTRYVRLEIITEGEAYQTSCHTNILYKWVNKGASIVSENKLSETFLQDINKYAADLTVTNCFSSLPHTLNISRYLRKTLTAIFKQFNQCSLKTSDIQGFLYEIQWRVKYGRFVDMSFWSILNHIRDLNLDEGSPVQVKKGIFSFDSAKKAMNPVLLERWGPTIEDIANNGPSPYEVSKLPTKKLPKVLGGTFRDFFNNIPEIKGGSAVATSRALLAVKIRFGESSSDIDFYKSDAICLGLKLKSEGFITNPIQWLVKKGFVKNVSNCYVCQHLAFLKETSKFNDGCSWSCQNAKCRFENMFRRPSFFARYPQHSMSHVAGMIFHWIVQSDESLITTDVPMDCSKILDAWRSFQRLCAAALRRKKMKLGGERHIVEVSVVTYGKLFILGAMDRKTKSYIVQAFPPKMEKPDTLYTTLLSWILPKTNIVIDASVNFHFAKYFKDYEIIQANTNVGDRKHPSCHVLNIESFLIKHLTNMFGHIKADLMRLEIFQGYLEELMWREEYGREPQQAFVYIMNEIFYNDLRYKSDFTRETRDPEFIPVKFKELRVVLRKIPNSVLKFYGCELPGSSKAPEDLNSTSSESMGKVPSNLDLNDADADDGFPGVVPICNQRVVDSDDEIIILDNVPRDTPEIKEIVLDDSPTHDPPEASESTSSSTTSENCTNKVQPLVIKMHKKRKKFRSYLKSELEEAKKTEHKKLLNCDLLNIPNTTIRVDMVNSQSTTLETTDVVSSDSSDSNSWETESNESAYSGVSAAKVTNKHSIAQPSLAQEVERPLSAASNSSNSNSWETESTDSDKSNERVTKKCSRGHSRPVQKERRPLSAASNSSHSNTWETESAGSAKYSERGTKKRSASHSRPVQKERRPKSTTLDSSHSNTIWETQSTDSSSNHKNFRKRSAAQSSLTQKEEKTPLCIECGEPVGALFEHFMKQFNCTDCKKKSVYTTCCSKSFFEHRGSLLFGKRMPRRKKEHCLHRPIIMKSPWHCACGFNTKIGNKLASHMLECRKRTCYYHQNLL